MKKIIKQGSLKFYKTCSVCDCEFEYETEDIVNNVVECPCCKTQLVHRQYTITSDIKPLKISYATSEISSDPCENCIYRNLDVNLCEACQRGFYQSKIGSKL